MFSQLIPNKQIGFRRHISTILAIFPLVEFLHQGYHSRHPDSMVTLDLDKVFDEVDHQTLIRTLTDEDINPSWIKSIQNYFTGRNLTIQNRRNQD